MVNGFQPFQPFGRGETNEQRRARAQKRQAEMLRLYQMMARSGQTARERGIATAVPRTTPVTARDLPPSGVPTFKEGAPPLPQPVQAPAAAMPGWKPEFGGWPGAGYLEAVAGGGAEVAGKVFSKIPPGVLEKLTDISRAGGASALSLGAELTNPFGVFGENPVPVLREFEANIVRQIHLARDRGESEAQARAAAPGRALEATKLPTGLQGALELVFDPLNLVPFGVATKFIKPLGKALEMAAVANVKRTSPVIARTAAGQYASTGWRTAAKRLEAVRETWKASPKVKLPHLNPLADGSKLRGYDNLKDIGTVLANLSLPEKVAGVTVPKRLRGVVSTPFSTAFKSINPGPFLAKTPVGRALLLHAYNNSMRASHVRGAMTEFRGKWEGWKELFDIDAEGYVRNVENPYKWGGRKDGRLHFLSLFEDAFATVTTSKRKGKWVHDPIADKRVWDPTPVPREKGAIFIKDLKQGTLRRRGNRLFTNMSEDQEKFIKELQGLFEEGGALARQYGVAINDVELASHGSKYIHRFVKGFEEVAGEAFGRTRAGRLKPVPDAAKSRKHLDQRIEEGINNGVDYSGDIMEGLDAYLNSMYRAANDRQLIGRLVPYAARVATLKGTDELDNLRNQVAGAFWNVRSLKAIEGSLEVAARTGKYPGRLYQKAGDAPRAGLSADAERVAAAEKIGFRPRPRPTATTDGIDMRHADIDLGAQSELFKRGKQPGERAKRRPRGVPEIGAEDRVARVLGVERHPEIYKALQKVNEIARDGTYVKNEAERKLRYSQIRDGVKEKVKQAQKLYGNTADEGLRGVYKSHTARTRLRREAEEQIRDIPQFRHVFFKKGEGEQIARSLGVQDVGKFEKVNLLMGEVAKLGDMMRVMKSGLDFGAPFLHGLPALAEDLAKTPLGMSPVKITKGGKIGSIRAGYGVGWQKPHLQTRWGKATANHFRVWFHPELHRKYLSENAETFREMSQWGVPLSGAASDYYVGLQSDAYLPRVLTKLEQAAGDARYAGKVARAPRKTLQKFEISFDSFGDYIRKETWEALRDTAAKKGDEGFEDLAAHVRNMTGAFNSTSVGISTSQQTLERAVLFFSPRYTRASMALLTDVFRGGLRGDRARKTIGSMLVAGTATHYALATMLGQEPNLDPTRGDFLSVKIAGQNMGPGSFFVSMLRTFSRIVEKGVTSPEDLKDSSTRDNPILGMIRGKGSPVSGLTWDIGMRADFLGNKLESGTDWAGHIFRQTLPFAAESALFDKEGDLTLSLPAFTTEMAGARSYPVSDRQLLTDARDEAAFNTHGKGWWDLNDLQRKRLEDPDEQPYIYELTQAVRQDQVARGDKTTAGRIVVQADKYHKESDAIHEDFNEKLAGGLELVNIPGSGFDLPRFIEDVYKPAQANKRALMDDLHNGEEFAELRQHWTELAQTKLGRPEAPEDIAYARYIDEIFDPELELEGGIIDFEERDRRKERFRIDYGDEVFAYILARFEEGRDLDPLVEEYLRGQQRFRYYWEEVDEQIFQQRPDGDSLRDTVKLYDRSTELGREELKDANPALRGFLKMRGRVKVQLRRQDPELDAYLYRWGISGTSRLYAPENEGREYDLRDPVFGRPR